jgi:hypothetical protein
MYDTILTAALTAPPIAPLAGSGPLKSKTISFTSASPFRSAPPSTSSRRKRSIAVGAEERSRESPASACLWSSAGSDGRNTYREPAWALLRSFPITCPITEGHEHSVTNSLQVDPLLFSESLNSRQNVRFSSEVVRLNDPTRLTARPS